MPAIGLSDLSNTFGWVKFYRAARGAGIKPIFGCDVWVTQRQRPQSALAPAAAGTAPRRLPAACANC
ncbi:MAG: PHP domain-containing protein [Comamonadaceae bacterium]|nr:PHP domain-containing protein [Comamonadaceae bacterium]